MNIGIFSVDPGGHTGLAWGIFNPHEKEYADAILGKMHHGSITVEGEMLSQVVEICDIWSGFYTTCVKNACLPPDKVFFVCEDFIPRGGQSPGGKESIFPSFIIGGLEGYRRGRRDEWLRQKRGRATEVHMPDTILQLAGDAFSFANKTRQKEWGLWVVGREHERSAWCHLALFLKKYMNGVAQANRKR
jgi:hypothetical protein